MITALKFNDNSTLIKFNWKVIQTIIINYLNILCNYRTLKINLLMRIIVEFLFFLYF